MDKIKAMDANDKKYIEIQNVEMRFDTKKGSFHALREINLRIAKGEFITLIGHSGCDSDMRLPIHRSCLV